MHTYCLISAAITGFIGGAIVSLIALRIGIRIGIKQSICTRDHMPIDASSILGMITKDSQVK
jgi:hypothetical protein